MHAEDKRTPLDLLVLYVRQLPQQTKLALHVSPFPLGHAAHKQTTSSLETLINLQIQSQVRQQPCGAGRPTLGLGFSVLEFWGLEF